MQFLKKQKWAALFKWMQDGAIWEVGIPFGKIHQKAKMKELEANILEYQKIIPDVMDSKTRIVRTKGSVKTQKLNDYGIPIPDSEDFS